jgi:hypothetical protein
MEDQRLGWPSDLETGAGSELGAPLEDKPRTARVEVGELAKRIRQLHLVLAALLDTCCVRLALDVGVL